MSPKTADKSSDPKPKIALVTDSTCDLPRAVLEEYEPVVVPLHFTLDGVEYVDGVDMDNSTYYERFRAAGQIAKSSQPSAGEFVKVYDALLGRHDAVVSVHASAKLSGTVESAMAAARSVDIDRVKVIDSRHISAGLGLVVQAASEAIRSGKTLDQVVETTEAATQVTRVYGAVPDLEVAVRGGRVSEPAARVADMVKLKPLIVFDKDGAAHVGGAALGFRRALTAMAAKVVRFASGKPVTATVVHADGLESAEFFRQRLATALEVDPSQLPLIEAGPVITTHVGLGTIAVGVQKI